MRTYGEINVQVHSFLSSELSVVYDKYRFDAALIPPSPFREREPSLICRRPRGNHRGSVHFRKEKNILILQGVEPVSSIF